MFVAVVPPDAAVEDLAAAVRAARGLTAGLDAAGIRWGRDDDFHLTLAFLGTVPAGRVDDLTARLARAAARHPPFELAIRGVGRFGQHLLWAGVSGERARVVALAASATAAAKRSRIPVDQRPYKPHLTLARGRAGADLRPAVAALRSYEGPAWTADRLLLVESRLGAGPGGTAAHDVHASWVLGASAGGD